MLLHIVNILVQTALKQTQVENYYGHFGRKPLLFSLFGQKKRLFVFSYVGIYIHVLPKL